MTINDNFAKLSEALFVADRHAREEVKVRAEMQSKLAAKEKQDKESKLRMLAQRAREERAGLVKPINSMDPPTTSLDSDISSHQYSTTATTSNLTNSNNNYNNNINSFSPTSSSKGVPRGRRNDSPTDSEGPSVRRGVSRDDSKGNEELEREELRRERQKMREKELRLANMGAETKAKVLSSM